MAEMASSSQPQDALCDKCNAILNKPPTKRDNLFSMGSFHRHHGTPAGLVDAAANGCPICVATVRELRSWTQDGQMPALDYVRGSLLDRYCTSVMYGETLHGTLEFTVSLSHSIHLPSNRGTRTILKLAVDTEPST